MKWRKSRQYSERRKKRRSASREAALEKTGVVVGDISEPIFSSAKVPLTSDSTFSSLHAPSVTLQNIGPDHESVDLHSGVEDCPEPDAHSSLGAPPRF